jgi:hypothetical protein
MTIPVNRVVAAMPPAIPARAAGAAPIWAFAVSLFNIPAPEPVMNVPTPAAQYPKPSPTAPAVTALPSATVASPRVKRARPDIKAASFPPMVGKIRSGSANGIIASPATAVTGQGVLQIERENGHHDLGRRGVAKHRNGRAYKSSITKQRQIDNWSSLQPLCGDENAEQDPTDGELEARGAAPPTYGVRVDQSPHQAEQTPAEQHDPGNVEPPGVGVTRLVDCVRCERDQCGADRNIHLEMPIAIRNMK